jgi:CBS domain containing-hemolysin-like protein
MSASDSTRATGYVRACDLALAIANPDQQQDQRQTQQLPTRPLIQLTEADSPIEALQRMQRDDCQLAIIVDGWERPTSVVSTDHLRELYFRGGR